MEGTLGQFIEQVSEESRTYSLLGHFREPFLTPLETSGLKNSFESLPAVKKWIPRQDLSKDINL